MRHCVKCGESLQENNKYCPKCGADNNFKIPDANEIAAQKEQKKVSPKDKKISLTLSLISFFMAIVPFITLYLCMQLHESPDTETLKAGILAMFLFIELIEVPFTGIGMALGVISYVKNKDNILSILSMILIAIPYVVVFIMIALN